MSQDPKQGESLSATRRRGAASRWSAQPMPEPVMQVTTPPPTKKKAAAKKAKPAWSEAQQKRLCEITNDAIAAYNAILAKPHGRLTRVTEVGIEKRRNEVARCIRAASRICQRMYQSPTVTPTFWEQYFREVNRDDFRSGRQPGGPGHENWKPGFKYLTREEVMIDVFEKAVTDD